MSEQENDNQSGQNEAWSKLLKPHEKVLNDFVGPLSMANVFAQSMANAKAAGLNPKVPTAAEQWAESIFEGWFAIVGQIAKSTGIKRRLLDRGLYDPIVESSVEWNEGLTLDLLEPVDRDDIEIDEIEEDQLIEDWYGPLGIEPQLLRRFNAGLPDKLFSGQYNRLFPVKIVMRTLANLIYSRDEFKILDSDEGQYEYDEILLEDLREESLKVAKYAKLRFEWIDARSGNKMGERLSVGLTDGSKKQNERFAVQFVGSVRNIGSGLPFELGLISLEEGEVKFTNNGVKFMLLSNPIFDTNDGWKTGNSFSKEEQIFLIRLIRFNAPQEFLFMQDILTWIGQGINSPKPLESKIIETRNISGTESSLLRSGILARMIELGIVIREQKGRKVTYQLTQMGTQLLSKNENQSDV